MVASPLPSGAKASPPEAAKASTKASLPRSTPADLPKKTPDDLPRRTPDDDIVRKTSDDDEDIFPADLALQVPSQTHRFRTKHDLPGEEGFVLMFGKVGTSQLYQKPRNTAEDAIVRTRAADIARQVPLPSSSSSFSPPLFLLPPPLGCGLFLPCAPAFDPQRRGIMGCT